MRKETESLFLQDENEGLNALLSQYNEKYKHSTSEKDILFIKIQQIKHRKVEIDHEWIQEKVRMMSDRAAQKRSLFSFKRFYDFPNHSHQLYLRL